MAEAKRREQWIHTSHLLAELANGPKTRKDKKPWTAQHFDPYAASSGETKAVKVTPQKLVKSLIRSLL